MAKRLRCTVDLEPAEHAREFLARVDATSLAVCVVSTGHARKASCIGDGAGNANVCRAKATPGASSATSAVAMRSIPSSPC